MNTRRIMRWVIVLFLLAALPGLTAVMAQDQEPAKQLPVVTAEGAAQASFGCNLYDSEPNDTPETADVIGFNDVMCGNLEPAYLYGEYTCWGATDWFTFYMPADGNVLLDIRGLYLYPNYGGDNIIIRLYRESYSSAGYEGAVQTLFQTSDVPLLMLRSLAAGNYFIRLYYNGEEEACGQDYSIALSSPVLVSAAAGNLGTSNVGGIPFQAGDILAHSDLNNGEERWVMLFDASDVGITKNVTNVAAHNGEEILLSLGANQTLPGVGTVTPWDIVVFDPDSDDRGSYGEHTVGTFRWGLPGREQGLTTSGEKLDAIDGFTFGYEAEPAGHGCYGFPVSTVGVATVNGPFGATKQDDEDVFCKVYNPNYGGWQHWDWFFDVNGKFDAPASEPAPGTVRGLPGEDVTAMAYDNDTDTMYLTILGTGNILGHAVSQKDIFALNYPSYSWGGVVWHGPDHGWNYNIDAFEYNPN